MNNSGIGASSPQKENTVKKKALTIWEALIPVAVLIILLAYNIFYAKGEWLGAYSNQFILLIGGLTAAFIGFYTKTSFRSMLIEVWKNWKSVFVPILILFLVGALAGTWLISGIIPTMVYYGLKILSPEIFLPACVVITALIAVSTGSSWTTTATVGIALIGIGSVLNINPSISAGAIISGAYFGDKVSPLSDTTNLAAAMAGTDLFTHIRYMSFTTVPSIVLTLVVFILISLSIETSQDADTSNLLSIIDTTFNITPWLFVVPLLVIIMILKKTKPLVALSTGVLLAAVFAFIFQTKVLEKLATSKGSAVAQAIFSDTTIGVPEEKIYKAKLSENDIAEINSHHTLNSLFTDDDLNANFTDKQLQPIFSGDQENSNTVKEKVDALQKLITIKKIKKLFTSGGMEGMLWTIYLILCAMVFGGLMESVGALSKITASLLAISKSIFGLFASTVVSCIGLNTIASDQFLSIVIPGKMFKKAYEDRNLAPENLSRTLEDSGTVTSVLIPWNTCGAYESSVLGVPTADYFFYAIFNWISPFTSLLFAAFMIKIKRTAETLKKPKTVNS